MPEKTRKIKKVQEKEAKKSPLNRKLLVFSITLATIIILGVVLYQLLWQTPGSEVKFSLKAAIIDQLSEDENLRNQTFVNEITAILSKNFTVTYYDYTKTNVTFFKELAKANYGIIILRLHSALRKNGSTVDFFTSEPYNLNKYVKEQEAGLLVNGTIIATGKQYFAFTAKFVEKLDGAFPKSIVIAMGCQTLNQTAGLPMARAFCDVKKATVYIGWSSWVSVQHSDAQTIKLVKGLLCENKTIEEAVKNTASDREFGAFFRFYPESAGSLKISDLIKEAETSGSPIKLAISKGSYIVKMELVNRFNSLATVEHSWFRRLSPVKFAVFNFLISSASTASSRTSFIHFSKSPR